MKQCMCVEAFVRLTMCCCQVRVLSLLLCRRRCGDW